MIRNLGFNIKTFFHLFFRGLNQADKVAFGSKEEALNKDLSIEQQQEVDCVWNDLIKGEVTQRVKDLRYETAHAVRESKHYEYIGNGIAKKRTMYEYKGVAENSEGFEIVLVQDNSKIITILTEEGMVDLILRGTNSMSSGNKKYTVTPSFVEFLMSKSNSISTFTEGFILDNFNNISAKQSKKESNCLVSIFSFNSSFLFIMFLFFKINIYKTERYNNIIRIVGGEVMLRSDSKVSALFGVSTAREKLFAKLGIHNLLDLVEQLVYHDCPYGHI